MGLCQTHLSLVHFETSFRLPQHGNEKPSPKRFSLNPTTSKQLHPSTAESCCDLAHQGHHCCPPPVTPAESSAGYPVLDLSPLE